MRAGKSLSGNAKKLFIFTGSDPVQVIEGTSDVRLNIDAPAADWSGTNQPKFGVVHRNRLVCFGNGNDTHRLYFSDSENHEIFVGGDTLTFSVYPGTGRWP